MKTILVSTAVAIVFAGVAPAVQARPLVEK